MDRPDQPRHLQESWRDCAERGAGGRTAPTPQHDRSLSISCQSADEAMERYPVGRRDA